MAVGKIQRTPTGLLQYLGMVGTGIPPTLMADEVRASFDITPFYNAGVIAGQSVAGNVQVPGNTQIATVPAGQAWLVLGGQLSVQAGAIGETVRTSALIGLKDGNNVRVATSQTMTSLAATARLSHGFMLPNPILLTPGESIGFVLEDSNLGVARTGGIVALTAVLAV